MSKKTISSKKPLISVLVCNYNYANYIEETLKSAILQDYANIEIIIVDDGSTDNSKEVIKNFIKNHSDYNINLISRGNKGIAFSRNEAIKKSNGEYFIFLDSDDLLTESYISKMFEVMQKTGAGVVYGEMKHFGDENFIVEQPDFEMSKFLLGNFVNITSLVKKEVVKGVRFDRAFDNKQLEDYDFWLGLALRGVRFEKAKDVFLNYRVHYKSRHLIKDRRKSIEKNIESWIEIIQKYQKQFPKQTKNAVENKLKYHFIEVDELRQEVSKLNDEIQNNLFIEIQKRDKHIQYLEDKIKDLEKWQEEIKQSCWYKIQNEFSKKLKTIKRRKNA